ncbi:MAG: lamin tail domain-containing protein [Pirellulales bacterium]|nr:lamin tail domain-containing protein [Pirellulales bacterium]
MRARRVRQHRREGILCARLALEPLEQRTLLDGLGTLGGTVFDDLDRDGWRDPGEPPLAGWTLELQRAGRTDTPQQTLGNPSTNPLNEFGRFVAADGDKVLVGSPRENLGVHVEAGAAYLFDGATGELLQTFENPTPADGDRFGRAVAAVGNHVLIGAPLDDTGAEDAGAVYLFDGQTGELLHELRSPRPRANDQFGRAIATVGNHVLVGARLADVISEQTGAIEYEDSGAAYLFDGTTGELLQTYLSPTPSQNAQFGYSVAAMGDNVLVGARWDETGTEGVGAVYLFDGATGNLLQRFLNPTQRSTGEPTDFGRSVAAVGDHVVIGARWDDSGAESAGAAFLFDSATGRLLRTLTSPLPGPGEEFGFCVTAMGNDVLVGARWAHSQDGSGSNSGGAVYLFDGTTGHLLQTITNPAPDAWDAFGTSVAALGERVVVGTQTGETAYVFDPVARSHLLTGSDGGYRFDDLPPGTYRVVAIVEDGYVQTFPRRPATHTVSLLDGETFVGLDFGNAADVPPVASHGAYRIAEDSTLTVAAAGGVLANDTDDDGDPLTASLVHAPPHGTLTLLSNGSFSYTPSANFYGSDSFTYRAHDGVAESNLATVTITVDPVNDPPLADDNGLWVPINTAKTVATPGLLADDVDPDGQPLQAVLVDPPAHGAVTIQSHGQYTYTPEIDYTGDDHFTYRAYDPQGSWDQATVHVTVSAVLSDALTDFLRITELNYNPYRVTPQERSLGVNSREAFEFIELQNTGSRLLDLGGVQLAGQVEFCFQGTTLLAPGEYALLVKDRAAFEIRYGTSADIVGVYQGELGNSGGWILLRDRFDRPILDFVYDDGLDRGIESAWPRWADGYGSTLQIVDPLDDYADGANWHASQEYGGSPGAAGSDAPPAVVINEVLAQTSLPLVDAIELHNRSGAAIDVGGWYLGNSANELRGFRIPDGTVIPAGGYEVFDEYAFNPQRWQPGAGGFALDGSNGDDVWLTAAGTDGALTRLVDHVEFTTAFHGESFGRWPDGSGRLAPMQRLTLRRENSGPRVGPILLSEVMYNPPDPGSGGIASDVEFVEVYNPTSEDLNLAGWQMRGGVAFDFPADLTLPAGGVLVVVGFDPQRPADAGDLRMFREVYQLDDSVAMVGPYVGRLNNGGNRVRLCRPDFPPPWKPYLVPMGPEDEVAYDNRSPWPLTADGEGYALHRRGVDFWGNDPASWATAPATPGVVDLRLGNLVISELNYNPYDPTEAELAVNLDFDNDDFEFIELLNIGRDPIELDGLWITDGVALDLGESTLAPGQRAVAVSNWWAFQVRYGTEALVVGEYIGRLDNGGERIRIASGTGVPILEFEYNDEAPWPERADGGGSSLGLLDATSDFDEGSHWRRSSEYGGSPGDAGTGPVAGVVINEVLSSADPPSANVIELYNTTDAAICVGGWYLTDSVDSPRKFRIPDGTWIEPHQYHCCYEAQFNPTPAEPAPSHFALDPFRGGELLLIQADSQTNRLTQFADHVAFGGAAAGEPFGRWPNGQGELLPMDGRTPGDPNSGPRVGPVVIHEIMYHPKAQGSGIDQNALEYIEIFNPTDETVDLTHWRISGGVEFDFPAGTRLAPHEALVVSQFDPEDASKLDALRLHYGINPWVDIVGGFSGSLNDAGETIRLWRAGQPPPEGPGLIPLLLEDEVTFDDDPPWPAMADGFGYSLSRVAVDRWGNDATGWTAEPPSPGMVGRRVEDLAITEVHYHAHDPTPAELAADPALTGDDFEFVELLNVAGEPLALGGIQLTGDVQFVFPEITLAANQRVLIVGNPVAFATRYDTTGMLIAGQYTGALSDQPTPLTLLSASGWSMLSFLYGSGGDWPARAGGLGSSLEVLDLTGYYDDPDNWQASTPFGGSPGAARREPSRDVVINEVLPHTTLPQRDAIELHNTTSGPIDVGNWCLSNSAEDYRRFRIPQPTVIPAGGFVALDQDDFAFALDDTGGTLWLLEGDAAGGLIEFADQFEYAATAEGRSFGRWPDGGDDLYRLAYPTLGEPNSRHEVVGSLVVTEINYHPYPPTPEELALYTGLSADDFEFIELQNVAPMPLDLTGVRFTDGITFDFTDSLSRELEPGEFVVLVRNLTGFHARYGLEIPVAGQFDGGLRDSGEQLALVDRLGDNVFAFEYDDEGDWPDRTDGQGASLELIDPPSVPAVGSPRTEFLENAANWRSSSEYGGTPGAAGSGPTGGVGINEVLTHTDFPSTDTIELINTTGQAIDVGGWYLSDSEETYQKFRIPDGTVVPPGGYVVFDEDDFNPTPWAPLPTHFALSGSHGDAVWLMAADASGRLTRFVDHVEFMAAANGESFGRWPDGTGDLYPMIEPTLDPAAGQNSGPRVGPVILSEIHYNPGTLTGADDLEFIEIYNPAGVAQDLTDWQITGGVAYSFAPGTIVAARSTIVVVPFDPADTAKLSAFYDHYGIGASVHLVGGYGGHLSNGGEEVRLLRPDEPPLEEPWFVPRLLEDAIRYDDDPPWPVEADGAGPSLSRTGPDAWGYDPSSWSSLPPTPGSVSPDWAAGIVAGRYVFYNNSIFDGNSAAANPQDDNAIAPDKVALLPGHTATLANYTSYSRGLNGVIVDVAGVGGVPTAADFTFRTGNDDNPQAWPPAPDPTMVTLRPGQGIDGSDRITIVWDDYAIARQWLQVTVLPTSNTGLAERDVFYFGNAVGESGNGTADAKVNATDMLLARNNPRNFLNPAAIDFPYDFDRDGRVNATDMLIARNNQTHFLNALRLISVPGEKTAVASLRQAMGPRSSLPVVGEFTELSARDAGWLYEIESLHSQHKPPAERTAWQHAAEAFWATYGP